MLPRARQTVLSGGSDGGKPVQITGQDYFACRLYKLTVSEEAQATLQVRVSLGFGGPADREVLKPRW